MKRLAAAAATIVKPTLERRRKRDEAGPQKEQVFLNYANQSKIQTTSGNSASYPKTSIKKGSMKRRKNQQASITSTSQQANILPASTLFSSNTTCNTTMTKTDTMLESGPHQLSPSITTMRTSIQAAAPQLPPSPPAQWNPTAAPMVGRIAVNEAPQIADIVFDNLIAPTIHNLYDLTVDDSSNNVNNTIVLSYPFYATSLSLSQMSMYTILRTLYRSNINSSIQNYTSGFIYASELHFIIISTFNNLNFR